MSASVEQIERPLMTPYEVMRLKPPKKSGSGSAERITAPGDMLIFVSGHHPIHGTQILHFSDPVLAKRAAIPPPTEFVAIEDGEVRAQRAADRTANVINGVPRLPAVQVGRKKWVVLKASLEKWQRENEQMTAA